MRAKVLKNSQPIKKSLNQKPTKHKIQLTKVEKIKRAREKAKGTQEYGTSKLEERFAKNILDKLGVEYVYQYKAESIERYYDFYLPEYRILIETDGDYYHSYGLVYEEMNPMQKKNKRVDEEKNHWARINHMTLIRIWEHDINKHPEYVLNFLKETLNLKKGDIERENNFKKRH